MEDSWLTQLLDRDSQLEVEERRYEQLLEGVRTKRKAISVLLVDDGVSGQGVSPGIAIMKPSVVIPRPRRGWTEIIRSVLSVHPESNLRDIIAYAKAGNLVPNGVEDNEFEKRMGFAIRDMTSKGFTIKHKADKKTPVTYKLNPDK